jgi:hypothetical protein
MVGESKSEDRRPSEANPNTNTSQNPTSTHQQRLNLRISGFRRLTASGLPISGLCALHMFVRIAKVKKQWQCREVVG